MQTALVIVIILYNYAVFVYIKFSCHANILSLKFEKIDCHVIKYLSLSLSLSLSRCVSAFFLNRYHSFSICLNISLISMNIDGNSTA